MKNLGVWFDSDFFLSKHVQNVCKSCEFRHVRWLLTHDTSVLVASGLVSSQLNYCNSLFRSLSIQTSSSIFINYSASKIVQLELYHIPVDMPV